MLLFFRFYALMAAWGCCSLLFTEGFIMHSLKWLIVIVVLDGLFLSPIDADFFGWLAIDLGLWLFCLIVWPERDEELVHPR